MLIKETISRYPEISALELLGEVNEFLQTESVKTILENISPKEYDSLIEDSLIESLEAMKVLTESDRSEFLDESKSIIAEAGRMRAALGTAWKHAKRPVKWTGKKILGKGGTEKFREAKKAGKSSKEAAKEAWKSLTKKRKAGIIGGGAAVGGGIGYGGFKAAKRKKGKK